jgi:glutamine cyclotransferase
LKSLDALQVWLHCRALPVVRPEIVRVFDHDPLAFTQGLVMHRGRLFESTGGDEASSLREVDPRNGRVLRARRVEGHFAEGLSIHEGAVYQLTWKSGRVFRYDLESFELTAEYTINHEGWGLAAWGGHLWVSDGSSRLRRYSDTLELLDVRSVTHLGLPMRRLNAMGVAHGRILANIWYSNWIAELDPTTGSLIRMIDGREIVAIEAPSTHHHVLNGIAVDEDSGTTYLTGKHWNKCFEVRIPEAAGPGHRATTGDA